MNDNRTRALPPRRAESRLVKAAADAVEHTCANPERADCPDSEAIQAVVRRLAHPDFDDIVDHIAMCAPCFDEYNRGRREYRIRRRRRLVMGCAALIVLGLLSTYYATRQQPRKNQDVQKQMVPPLLASSIDYSSWTGERSTSPEQHRPETPRLPRTRLAVTLVLPIGTQDGPYAIQIRSTSGDVVAQATGIAKWIDGAEKLNATLDLRRASAGAYTIVIQPVDGSPRTYPLLLE